MSFQLSPGTLDSMAGVFAPAKKRQPGSGGGKGRGAKPGGTILGLAAASMIQSVTGDRPDVQTKRAFRAGSQSSASRRAVLTMERTARGAPEVVVRVTGRQHGAGHVLANFAYISRLGHSSDKSVGLYTSDGDIIRDGSAMQVLAQDWHEWEMGGDARRKGATTLSMILSMPAGTNPERLKEAALDFAREQFANRSWVASLHVDRDHPHVHLTFARRDHDGRRFHPDRDDLLRYRQRFADKLRARGIEANATPAKARGVDRNHEPIAARKVREKGGTPWIDESRAKRIATLHKRGLPDPASTFLAHQHDAICAAYERSIVELSTSSSLVDQAVATSLERFVRSLSAPTPNSARAVRQHTEEAHGRDGTQAAERARAGDAADADALAAALARSKAMGERLKAAGDLPQPNQRDRTEQGRGSPPSISGRLRTLMEEATRLELGAGPSTADEILRQVEGRDRAQHEPHRSSGKGVTRR